MQTDHKNHIHHESHNHAHDHTEHHHECHEHEAASHEPDCHEAHTHEENGAYSHFAIPFFLIFAFAIVEAFGGFWTGSLALLSDAGHMFSDVAALGLAWFGAVLARKPNAKKHASGITVAELNVSIINAITMVILVTWVIVEAIARYKAPQAVKGMEVMVIAAIGLVVNLIVAKQLHQQAHSHAENLNSRAAFLHVLGDLLGSVTAIVAGLVIYLTGWLLIDPILSLFISVLLGGLTFNLIRDIWRTIHLKQPKSHHHHH